jgi:hypothetical protein
MNFGQSGHGASTSEYSHALPPRQEKCLCQLEMGHDGAISRLETDCQVFVLRIWFAAALVCCCKHRHVEIRSFTYTFHCEISMRRALITREARCEPKALVSTK